MHEYPTHFLNGRNYSEGPSKCSITPNTRKGSKYLFKRMSTKTNESRENPWFSESDGKNENLIYRYEVQWIRYMKYHHIDYRKNLVCACRSWVLEKRKFIYRWITPCILKTCITSARWGWLRYPSVCFFLLDACNASEVVFAP